MSITLRPRAGICPVAQAVLRAMDSEDIDAVDAIERQIYPFPWTRGNFLDSIAAGYDARVLVQDEKIIAYSVAMSIPEEIHLLNLTVALTCRRQGIGRWMLLTLFERAQAQALGAMLLEVRPSNAAAQALYRTMGFEPIGLRRRYYPNFNNTREDAIVMRCRLDA